MQRSEQDVRREICEAALKMARSGLTPGRSGNISARFGEGMLITPSGRSYEDLAPQDIVWLEGEAVRGDAAPDLKRQNPSSEWQMHAALYLARAEAAAIVHCHSLYATVLAASHRPIPAFHYMVAIAGGAEIPLAPYATFGSRELAQHASAAMRGAEQSAVRACLLANHGQITLGKNVADALELAFEIETLSAQYYKTLAIDGVHLLPADEMACVIEKFKTYANAPGSPKSES